MIINVLGVVQPECIFTPVSAWAYVYTLTFIKRIYRVEILQYQINNLFIGGCKENR